MENKSEIALFEFPVSQLKKRKRGKIVKKGEAYSAKPLKKWDELNEDRRRVAWCVHMGVEVCTVVIEHKPRKNKK